MIYHLLITIAIMAGLMLGYYLVQRGLRRACPGARDDYDVLEDRWGCAGCLLSGSCKWEPEAESNGSTQLHTK